ncbi:M23 family metallopeptidase [Neolewinella aurantiaca]|uniref:M23 family metallopeptidase n=1 Tax=Neolewinella aurantiaca TaxID=2602767 RepID=A0A5C7FF69_9BACT|nr:M23 family metallopeptidase [Neolewinella aurantiaca]TXF89438.1 M23 family metallopeptidase [Neolewinella aurantiaca]
MIILSEHQVARVQAHLARAGLNEQLSTELLDHLCCAIEARMTTGESFDQALSETLKSWPIRQLRDLQKTINFTTKTKPMLYRASAAIALVAGICLLSPFTSVDHSAPLALDHHDHSSDYAADYSRFDPPTASPIAGVDMKAALSSGFGMRKHPLTKRTTLHRGIDLKAKVGTPVQATAPGKVIYAGEDGNYGITVRILHEDGYVTAYCHLSKHVVERGDRVILGQEIAAVGTTGQSLGPHLHYEVLKDDVPVNPLALVD